MAYDGVNLPAALVGALLAYLLGALWYSPLLFARPWMRAVGKTEEELGDAKSAFVVTGVAWIVAALALAYLLTRIPYDSPADALLIGAAAWLLPGAMTVMNSAFERRPSALWMINGGYMLLGFLLVAAVLAYWP